MTDWGVVAIRFALYSDLMLLVGLAAFPLYSFNTSERQRFSPIGHISCAWLALAGLLLSVIGFAFAAAQMMGVTLDNMNPDMALSIARDSDIGTALWVRSAALIFLIIAVVVLRRSKARLLIAACAGGSIALATLIWPGHAASTEGLLGTVHRISDSIHMIAASLWIGGIAALGGLLFTRFNSRSAVPLDILVGSLRMFSRVGTVAVSAVAVTGIVNSFAITQGDIGRVCGSTYGLLLATKIVLFIGMLGFAAINRWKLTPALENCVSQNQDQSTRNLLRLSVALELFIGLLILAIVALLGTMAPDAAILLEQLSP